MEVLLFSGPPQLSHCQEEGQDTIMPGHHGADAESLSSQHTATRKPNSDHPNPYGDAARGLTR